MCTHWGHVQHNFIFMKAKLMALLMGLTFAICATLPAQESGKNVGDYMVKYDVDGKEYWFNLKGGDTVALDGPPAHLLENPADVEGQTVNPQSLQDIELPSGPPTLEWLFNTENGVFAGLLTLLMYLSSFIPGLKAMPDKRKRALALGIFLIAGVAVWRLFDKELTFINFAGTVMVFLQTQLVYIFGLKPAGLKTPDAKQ